MPEFGKTIRPDMPPTTPAEKHYAELNKPGADEKFAAEFPAIDISSLIKASNEARITEAEREYEKNIFKTIAKHEEFRRQYLAGCLQTIERLFKNKTFTYKSTLEEMFDYFQERALKIESQTLDGETRAKDQNTIHAMLGLLGLINDGCRTDSIYPKVIKEMEVKLKDVTLALKPPKEK